MTTALLLIVLGAAWRLLVNFQVLNLPNYVPLTAICLYAALKLPRRYALAVPLALLLLSDLVIDSRHGYMFFPLSRITTYVFFAAIAFAGRYMPKTVGLPGRLAFSFVGATLFFFVSNFMVWLGGEGYGYAPTFAGLMQCYTEGIPFYKNMLYAEGICAAAMYVLDLALAYQTSAESRAETVEVKS